MTDAELKLEKQRLALGSAVHYVTQMHYHNSPQEILKYAKVFYHWLEFDNILEDTKASVDHSLSR